jgi:hypothetical protein
MRPRLNLRAIVRLGFPLCGWLSLALFVFVASGLPIPLPFAKDLSRPFPCMFHQCGCRSAEQCWQSCCCHSAAERVAWARSHQLRPPVDIVEGAQAECLDRSCESRKACCTAQPPKQNSGAISLIAALKCRGQHELTAGVPICLPPRPLVWQPLMAVAARASATRPSIPCWFESPPVPPPRISDC